MAKPLIDPGRFTILDGALGTMLQAAGLAPGQSPELFSIERPEVVTDIHRAYVQAGAQLLCANTFGANAKKLAHSGISVRAAVHAGIACAKAAAGEKALVALDIGPLGEMLEPGGTLAFEEACALFAEVVREGAAAGADVVMIETMADLYEMKAAVLAVKENCSLPVLASMTFEEDGRSFAGVPIEAFATAIEGLGPLALGINCSLGPAEVMPLLKRLCAATRLPVFAKPNAGLPDPQTGAFSLSAQEFCAQMQPCEALGVAAVGGCCGTTPEAIALLAQHFAGKTPAKRTLPQTSRVCGATVALTISRPEAIGERINPTGKKRLREALLAGDLSYIQTLAVQQQAAGAAILDVNVGAPGVDEVDLLPRAVKAVQAVCGLPLQLDSANPAALAAGLRVCCGKPIVNSTSGEVEKLDAILPLCKRYGAGVVGLTLDEGGIPETAEERIVIAQKILDAALAQGIAKEDVYIDTLTMTVGAAPGAARETLKALRLVKERLGLRTLLGVSNVSFGLPERPLVNRTFLAMALAEGLDLPILNPADEGMMGTLRAFGVLGGEEEATRQFLEYYAVEQEVTPKPPPVDGAMPLDKAIEKGLKTEAAAAAKRQLAVGAAAMELVDAALIPALDRVGAGFEAKTVFLPQLLAVAGAAQAAFEVIRDALPGGAAKTGPPVVVATVQGDVHDIGKNIAKVLLENYGFNVIDLGRDVPPARVVQAVKSSGAKLCGLSALMTTTLPAMEATVAALRKEAPGCKIMVGGAVLTGEYVAKLGADCFASDAKKSADYARMIYDEV